MGRILVVVLGLGAVAFGAYYAVKGNLGAGGTEKSAPKQTLDNVRAKTKAIEDDAQKRADEMMKKSTGAE
jgi:hypothetical protein